MAFWEPDRGKLALSSVFLQDIRFAHTSKNHTASFGFVPHRRHALRVACHAERSYLDPASKSQEEDYAELYGIPLPNKDGSGQSNYND